MNRERLRIDGLLWEETNEEHIAGHKVTAEEVEEAVFDPVARVFRTRSGREGERRYIVLGLTESGRHLFVVLEHLREGALLPGHGSRHDGRREAEVQVEVR